MSIRKKSISNKETSVAKRKETVENYDHQHPEVIWLGERDCVVQVGKI